MQARNTSEKHCQSKRQQSFSCNVTPSTHSLTLILFSITFVAVQCFIGTLSILCAIAASAADHSEQSTKSVKHKNDKDEMERIKKKQREENYSIFPFTSL